MDLPIYILCACCLFLSFSLGCFVFLLYTSLQKGNVSCTLEKTFMTATENKWSNIWKMGHFQAHQFKELFMLRVRVRVICVYCIQTCKYIDIDMLSVQHEAGLIPMKIYLICIHWVFIRIRFRLRQQKNTRTRTRTKDKSTTTTPAPVSFGRLQDKLCSF